MGADPSEQNMDDPDVPLEQVQEDINHHAHTDGHLVPWTRWVALSTALIAVLAALASLMAGHSETEMMRAKMEANDKWSYFGVQSIKQHTIENTEAILRGLGKTADPAVMAKLEKYEAGKKATQAEAKAYNGVSLHYLHAHMFFGYAVTLFQVSIALSAISALTRRRGYWLISLGIGSIGVLLAVYGAGVLMKIHEPTEKIETMEAPT